MEMKTRPSLLHALSEAVQRKPTTDEIQRQRVSFVVSAVKESGGVTKARVKEILAEQEGGNVG